MRWSGIIVAVAIVVVLSAGTSVSKADITVTSWELRTYAREGTSVTADQWDNTSSPSLPWSFSRTVSAGASTTTNSYDFFASSDFARFDFIFDHNRAGALGSNCTATGAIYFTTDEDLSYNLLGWYSLAGQQTVQNSAGLKDVTPDVFVGRSLQVSRSTPDQTLTLGELDGDSDNLLIGSLSGTLLAGHTYQFGYHPAISAHAFTDSGASGDGFMRLELQTIPAPGAAPLAIIGLGMLVFARRYLG